MTRYKGTAVEYEAKEHSRNIVRIYMSGSLHIPTLSILVKA